MTTLTRHLRIVTALSKRTRDRHATRCLEEIDRAPVAYNPNWTARIGKPVRTHPGHGFADDPKITTREWRGRP